LKIVALTQKNQSFANATQRSSCDTSIIAKAVDIHRDSVTMYLGEEMAIFCLWQRWHLLYRNT
jgi:hypothetical protein